MRLPFSKVYRAFPELDRFTDEQCEEYIRQVRRRFRLQRRFHSTLTAIGAVALAVAIFIIMVIVFVMGRNGMGPIVQHPLFGSLVLAGVTGGPPVLTLLALRHRWLRRRIGAHMAEIRCTECGYLLLGLGVREGAVACPECGTRVVLATLGLTPSDILGVEPATPENAAAPPL